MTTTLPTCFKTFLSNIEPSPEMKKYAQEAHIPIREHLEKDEEFGQYFEDSFLYGSYARHTAFGNIKDVDIVVLTNFDPNDIEHTPKKVLAKLKSALLRYYGDPKSTQYNRKSIQVLDPLPDNPDVEMTLDVIPTIPVYGNQEPLLVPDREDGKWVPSHPRGHLAHTSKLNNEEHGDGMFVPLVKIMKHWWAYNAPKKKAKPKGFWLEVLTGEHFDQNQTTYAEHFVAVLESVSNTHSNYLSYQEPPRLIDPGMNSEKLQTSMSLEEFQAFMGIVNTSLEQAKLAIASEEGKASIIWNQLFGDEFPVIEDVSENKQLKANSFTDTWYSRKEQFLFRDFEIRRRKGDYPIRIVCDVVQDGWRKFELSDNSFVRKQCSLTFRVKGLERIPKPYKLMWKVKNTGPEAASRYQLRGEITPDNGTATKYEETLYTGIHYVECYVIDSNNKCIAQARKYVRIP
jgi:hypothetical protein